MSEAERDEWDRRYAAGDYRPRSWPSPFLEGWLGRIPASGRALDVACGAGRNALRLAEAGFDVDAVDISAVAVEQARAEAQRRGLEVRWHVADLDDLAVAEGRYRLITVIRYRNRSLWPRLVTALAPDGWLLAEHHFRTSAAVDGPSDTFRLEPGELLEAFGGLRVLLYEEAIETDRDGRTYALARIVACIGDPGF